MFPPLGNNSFPGLFSGEFDLCPFPPEVDAGSCLQNFCDVGTTDARGNFQKEKPSIGGTLDKFRMRRPIFQTKCLYQLAVYLKQSLLIIRSVSKRLRNVSATLMGHFHRWPPIPVCAGKRHLAIVYQ